MEPLPESPDATSTATLPPEPHGAVAMPNGELGDLLLVLAYPYLRRPIELTAASVSCEISSIALKTVAFSHFSLAAEFLGRQQRLRRAARRNQFQLRRAAAAAREEQHHQHLLPPL
jgi:hypothetical protein